MKEQFVSLEIALKLKELGFDEPCLACYTGKYFGMHDSKYLTSQEKAAYIFKIDTILAPLWQQAIDWFREKYNIKILIEPTHACYNIGIYKYYEDEDNNLELPTDGLNFKDFLIYEEARKEAILKAIELINERTL